jgi:MFS family permease
MKLDHKKAILIGLGLFSVQMAWVIYNTYVPIYLQAGDPVFDAQSAAQTRGFGLSATLTGLIMTLDNIAAFFIQPIMGPISDRTRTRFGRRMPYIITMAPLAVLAFALIPLAPQMIPAELNGQLAELSGPFIFFLVAVGVMLVAMALFRTPLFALMPDLIPSPLRSQANGVINLMAGVGGIIAFVAGGLLYNVYRPLPFWVVGAITLISIGVLFWKIKEPKELVEAADTEGDLAVLRNLRDIPRENRRSLGLLILTIFFYMVGFNAIETFFSSYGVNTLGVKESTAAMLLAASYVSFILFAVPAGMLAGRFGRKRTIMAGLALFAVVLGVAFFTPVVPAVVALLAVGGLAWALININGLPMVLDISTTEALMGTYTGLYFIAATLAAAVGPILNGFIIDLTGRNYNMIFLVCPAFFLLALLCMVGVTKGEAKTQHAIRNTVHLKELL